MAPHPLRVVQPAEGPISIDRARELLGDDAFEMTDEEVMQASERAEHIAHVIVQMFQEHRRQ
jgi:hypothetical protein